MYGQTEASPRISYIELKNLKKKLIVLVEQSKVEKYLLIKKTKKLYMKG